MANNVGTAHNLKSDTYNDIAYIKNNIETAIGLKFAGLVFTKGLRLSQVLGLNPVLKLRLLSQLSFVLKPYSQRVT